MDLKALRHFTHERVFSAHFSLFSSNATSCTTPASGWVVEKLISSSRSRVALLSNRYLRAQILARL